MSKVYDREYVSQQLHAIALANYKIGINWIEQRESPEISKLTQSSKSVVDDLLSYLDEVNHTD